MSSKVKLISLIASRLPLDRAQKNAVIDGIHKLTDIDAEQIAQSIETALDNLPDVLGRLDTLLAIEEQRRQK